MGFIVRNYQLGDHGVFLNLWERAYASIHWRSVYPPQPEVDLSTFDRWVGEGVIDVRRSFVAEAEGKPVGISCVNLVYLDRKPVAAAFTPAKGFWGNWESLILVDPAWRGREVGTSLIKEAMGRLREEGLRRFLAWVFDENEPAVGFLRRLGFRETPLLMVDGLRVSSGTSGTNEVRFYRHDLRHLPKVEVNVDVACRPVAEGDLEKLALFYSKLRGGEHKPTLDEVARTVYRPRYRYFVAELSGEIVGLMGAWFNGELVIPGVIPELRGKGIGSALMHYALNYMKREGYPHATACSPIDLEGAHRLYRRFDFALTRRLLLMCLEA